MFKMLGVELAKFFFLGEPNGLSMVVERWKPQIEASGQVTSDFLLEYNQM